MADMADGSEPGHADNQPDPAAEQQGDSVAAQAAASSARSAPDEHCGWCGEPAGSADDAAHERCRARLGLIDPPRFCVHCARRMVVQVTPAGWTATCSRHGVFTSAG